ncbi:sideroflexin-2 [Condylostylus longicornis]|uniref:sideroflexin-2 n=1 Tax=Condylostylus longicornis TaxID=2530218 RepID=UPI00244E024F|nr:sideroflexin-2 [Condylostylus longicornis]
MTGRIEIDKPLWDLNTFTGRFNYFAWMTDPRTCILPSSQLLEAKELLDKYRKGQEPSTTKREDVVYAMKLYKSAFHPDTGELQNFTGRMSFQVPGGMLITGAMLSFYRTTGAVVFWQFVNQSFNAVVNYTNRNAKSPTTVNQLIGAYLSATSAAVATAIGFKNFVMKRASPLLQRYVPFTAVAAANCVNIPLMRQNEIINGIDVEDHNGNTVGKSRVAAVKGIFQVVQARIAMAAPGMLVLPIIMERLEKYPGFKRMTGLHAPFQTIAVGMFLLFMVPSSCAIYPQRCSLRTSTIKLIEPEFYDEMVKNTSGNVPEKVYFNKGL